MMQRTSSAGPAWPARTRRPRGRACRRTPLSAFLAVAALAAAAAPAAAQQPAGPDAVPLALDHGWPVAAPSSVGFDPQALERLVGAIAAGEHGTIDALVIVKDGKLVLDRYFTGYTIYTLHTLQSVTKSVASTLIGIALAEGVLGDIDQPIHELLPEHRQHFEADPRKRAITLRHLLTMTAGFDWPELGGSYYGAENIVWKLEDSYDWPGFVLARPLTAEPGTVFNYSTGVSTLLGAILQNAAGMPTEQFAERYLFDPLGIPLYGWWRNMEHPGSWVHTGGGLHLTPRDLAKIGQLFLDGGRWRDRPVITAEWAEAATSPHVPTGLNENESYGYQWWLRPLSGPDGQGQGRVIQARGLGGQHLLIVPEHDLVVVFTSTNFGSSRVAAGPFRLLHDAIIPALR